MNYVCKYGLYHDKPSIGKTPSSNNGFIYTAYANQLGLPLEMNKIETCFENCKNNTPNALYHTFRLPNLNFPLISRDEIIGMTSLGFNPMKGKRYFLYNAPTGLRWIDYIKAIYGLIKIRNEHRNYFWRNKRYDLFPIAMKLAFHDRYYIDKMAGEKSNPFYFLFFCLYIVTTLAGDNLSAKNVLWLQLKDLNFPLIPYLMGQKLNFLEYFGKKHPFNLLK